MEEITPSLKKKLSLLPDSPGVYLLKNRNGEVLYVGKALVLKNRLRSYFTDRFRDDDPYQAKLIKLMEQVYNFDYIVTTNEEEAFILEANLIKQHRPRYNVSFKDDKHYPFIRITLHEPFPRVIIDRDRHYHQRLNRLTDSKPTTQTEEHSQIRGTPTHDQTVRGELVYDRKKDGSKYFGPYTDASSLRQTLRLIGWLLPVRTCQRNIPANNIRFKKPCLNYQLSKCSGPCIGKISQREYRKLINNVISFLTGRNNEIIESLKQEMQEYSDKMDYEKAAKIRDRIKMFERVQKSQKIFFLDDEDRDIIAVCKEERLAVVTVLKILGGRLLYVENYRLENVEDTPSPEILSAFVNQYYADKMDTLPHKILLTEEPQDLDGLNHWLKNRVSVPKRGENRRLINLARKNVFDFMETIKLSHLRKSDRTVFPIQELKEKLNLPKLPRKIICLDVSTIQGTDTVSSIVYFENGKPLKRGYRHFRINTVEGQDDYAAMKETLTRYLSKITEDEKPDLLIVDGGKGQLNSALSVMKDFTEIAVISLAKRLEEVYLPSHSEPLSLPRSSSALRLLVTIRDEAHRFAIGYHRKRRTVRTIRSDLDKIKGIGKDKKFLLLKHFGSVENIKKAGEDDLIAVKGIGSKTAKLIYNYLHQNRTD